jgi:hypothetical protein
MAERRHRTDDNEIIQMQSMVSAMQLVPHERRDHVMAYVRDRVLSGLAYIDPTGQEVPPPQLAPPMIPLPERRRDAESQLETEPEDKTGG